MKSYAELREDNEALVEECKRLEAEISHFSGRIMEATHYASQKKLGSAGSDSIKRLIESHTKLEKDHQQLKQESDAVWETLIAVADMLEIDPVEARKIPGKPSDVYRKHLAIYAVKAINQSLDSIGYPATKFKDKPDAYADGFNYACELLKRNADPLLQKV